MKTAAISIDMIRTDGGTQMRASLDQEVYLHYRDLWQSGVEFDPCDVFHDGSVYWLADGFHRFYGAREAKRASLPCRIHQGTQRDAILFAAGANATHGLRRTNEDKQIAVKALLGDEEWTKWSNGVVAEKCHVTPQFVGEIRRQLETVSSSPAAKAADEPRVGRDGKKRKPRRKPMKPAGNGKTREPGEDAVERRHKQPDPDATPFDDHVLRCETVLKSYVPNVQQYAIEIERLLGRAVCGGFAPRKVESAAAILHQQFTSIIGVLRNAQQKHKRKAAS